MADSQDQGKQSAEEVAAEVTQQAKTLADRAATAGDRLDNFFSSRKPSEPEAPAQETAPEPTPSSEQVKTEVPLTDIEVAEKEALENSKNPERTKAYIDKLKADLAEAKAQKLTPQIEDTSVFDSFRPKEQLVAPIPPVFPQPNTPFLNPQTVTNITDQFVDQQGNVDITGLNQALTRANQQAQAATAEAKRTRMDLERFEENQQVREAHGAVPEIDPNQPEKFNKDLFEAVRDRLLRNMYEGRKQTLLEVATDLRNKFGGNNIDKVKEDAITQYKQAQTRKDTQTPIESGKGQSRETLSDAKELREKTRRGDPFALDERLRKAGILKAQT